MPVQIHEHDTLAHLEEHSLHATATIHAACLTIFNQFGLKAELCYEIHGHEVCVEAKLSAFGQSVNLGKKCIEPGHSTTLKGHIDSIAKIEITVSVDAKPLQFCFDVKGCVHVPVVGWRCAHTGKHCIKI